MKQRFRIERRALIDSVYKSSIEFMKDDRLILALPIVFLTTLFWHWDVSYYIYHLLALVGLALPFTRKVGLDNVTHRLVT